MHEERPVDHVAFDEVQVESEHVRLTALVLLFARDLPPSIRGAAITAGLLAAGIRNRILADAILARLRAATLLDVGLTTDAHCSEALSEAIAFAPLYPVGEYYYFLPEEFRDVLARRQSSLERRAETIVRTGI